MSNCANNLRLASFCSDYFPQDYGRKKWAQNNHKVWQQSKRCTLRTSAMSTRQANHFLNKVQRGGKGATIILGHFFRTAGRKVEVILQSSTVGTIHLIPETLQHYLLIVAHQLNKDNLKRQTGKTLLLLSPFAKTYKDFFIHFHQAEHYRVWWNSYVCILHIIADFAWQIFLQYIHAHVHTHMNIY